MKRSSTLLLALAFVQVACGGSTTSEPRTPEGGAATETTGKAAARADAPAAVAPVSMDFADEEFAPTNKAGATYRLERTFVEPIMLIEGVPTYDQGMGLKASQTPMDRYTFSYHRLDDDSLAFSVETTVLRDDDSQFIFSGTGIWYDRNLVPTAKATFDGGKLQGEYQELDADGEVTGTVIYDKGEPYDPERFSDAVHLPLVGTWQSDTDKGSSVDRLVNVYGKDGTLQLYRIKLNKNSVLGGDDGLLEWSRTKPTTLSWKYTPRDDSSGDAEYYQGNALQGRSRLKFTGPDSMEARIIFHVSPSMVGKRYSFKRTDS